MLNAAIDYALVVLEENIPLNNEDIIYIKRKQQSYKVIPVVIAFATLLIMGFVCWLMKDHFKTFRYYDYLLLTVATLGLYAVGLFCSWLITRFDFNNLRKDVQSGKCRLTSVIISRDKTEYGEYLTFAGPDKKSEIRVLVKEADFKQYPLGTYLLIEYLKHSREALTIVKV